VQHVRGVDIVGLPPLPDNRLLLIEIKDYRVSQQPAEREVAKLRQTIIQKALNTVSGLYAAARVGDAELLPVTARMFQATLNLEVVLLLEQPPVITAPTTTALKLRRLNPQTALNDLRLELTSVLGRLGFTFRLRSSRTIQLADGWTMRLH
jgi:hypothetical protein